MVATLVSTHMRIGLTSTSAVQFVFRKWYCIQWVRFRLWAANSPTFSAFTYYHYNHMTSICVWCMYSSHQNLLISYDSANFVPYNQECLVHRIYWFEGGGWSLHPQVPCSLDFTVHLLHLLCSRYDPHTNQWSSDVAPTSSCRTSVGVAVLGDFLYAVGGQDGVSCLNYVERFAPFLAKAWNLSADEIGLTPLKDFLCVCRQSRWHFALDNLWKMCHHL